ncbi:MULTISPECIES: thioesterase family protein [unclassified Serratia (in: enterobacteria)]|uniref:acyl-CoA thioesterase n=1 Tax=unclassified Serratia (in: enterobacteria) TaxID=2647522 RepID=UPI0004FF911C|nr:MULTISPECIES: thioesterase family protein [unclassified Serratia (in: enterobacteria)]KFK95702.1 4-hydroxybenzoyl-CoA thioesterase [Serratia sp. Ag2]KFK95954.1 4-hydroxybenzoyl-CoA thioesterase [Serratia sp. Ag1]
MEPLKFTQPHRIHFSECDPAGIVFYPQYFVMFNNLLEAWFDQLIPQGFAGFIIEQRYGIPTVHIDAEFKAVSRMGDDVHLELQVERIGQKSLVLKQRCISNEGELRMQVTQTYVTTSLDTHRAIPIPDELYHALTGNHLRA